MLNIKSISALSYSSDYFICVKDTMFNLFLWEWERWGWLIYIFAFLLPWFRSLEHDGSGDFFFVSSLFSLSLVPLIRRYSCIEDDVTAPQMYFQSQVVVIYKAT